MLQTMLDGGSQSGHDLELIFLEAGPWAAELSDAGFRVDVVPAGRMRQPHRAAATIVRLLRIFRQRRPDLIVNWSAKTHLYSAPAAVLAGMTDRVVWWQQLIPADHWLDRCATALPAKAIGCYSDTAAKAQTRLFPHRRTFVVAPGVRVPSTHLEEIPLELPPKVPIVGLVGRLQPWKGQDRLLGAQALLASRGHDMHTVLVGGDAYGLSPDYASRLPLLVSQLKLVGDVTLVGHVPDAGPYIGRMDVLVNASDPEPFGIVLLEAMAQGIAVVAVNSGGPAEFIEPGKTGMLARSGEPEALADALVPLLESRALRDAIGSAGRERFIQEFTDVAARARFFRNLEALVAS